MRKAADILGSGASRVRGGRASDRRKECGGVGLSGRRGRQRFRKDVGEQEASHAAAVVLSYSQHVHLSLGLFPASLFPFF